MSKSFNSNFTWQNYIFCDRLLAGKSCGTAGFNQEIATSHGILEICAIEVTNFVA